MARSTTSAPAPSTSTPGSTADRRGPSGLTPRQMEAALLAQSGLSAPDIAVEMGLSQRGVRRHLTAARAEGVATTPVAREAPAPDLPRSKRTGRITKPKPKPAYGRVLLTDDVHGVVQYRHAGERGTLGTDYLEGDPEMIDGQPTGRYLIGSSTIQQREAHALTDFHGDDETAARALRKQLDQARRDGFTHAPIHDANTGETMLVDLETGAYAPLALDAE